MVAAILLYAVDADGPLGEVGYLLTYAAGAALAWVGVARHPPGRRSPWTYVAAAATITMVGDLVYEVVLGAPAGATISDPLWIAAYGTLTVGLLQPVPLRSPWDEADADALIDSLVALIVGIVVAWEIAISDLLARPEGEPLDQIVAAVYPFLDVVLLAVAVRLLLRGDRSRPVVLASVGTLVLLVADLTFAATAEGMADTRVVLAWMAALLLLSSSTLPSDRRYKGNPSGRVRMWLVLAPVGVPVSFLLWGQVTHDHPNTWLTPISVVALLGLAAIRAQRLLRAVEEARAAIEAREHRFRALAANAADAVCIANARGELIWGEDNLARLLGVEPEQVRGATAADEDLLVDPPAVQMLLGRANDAPGVVFSQEIEVRRPDGTHRWWEASVVSLLDDVVVDGVVANLRDVTERRRIEDELRDRAFHDATTGLANRALLRDRVEQALRRGARRGTGPAVLHLHLDGFRPLVDQQGHEAGDRLLRQVADRLRTTVRSEDSIARVGIHELAVLIEENHAGTDQAATTAERIIQVLSTPLAVDGREVTVTTSVGLAVGDVAATVDDLLRNADIALERAKGAGEACVAVYEEAMGAEVAERTVIRATLPHAVARDQLDLLYEPVVRLADGTVMGFEARPRWRHPDLGVIPADRFLPLLEESDTAPAIGRWMLDAACIAGAAWPSSGPGGVVPDVGVHLPARHLLSEGITDDVRRALDISGLHAPSLVLEVTESALTSDAGRAAERLDALTALGVRVAVDDFGAGSSSLAHLRQLAVHILKVDHAFIDTIDEGSEDVPPIVRALLDLAATLGLAVVAEGLTHVAQRDGLRRAGCAMAQGPLFSSAVAVEDTARLVRAGHLGPPTDRPVPASPGLVT
ncbi:EAL domain-containing protein [Iamia sp. SCSIO 61187]|uniref:putative bifunctional diguanylate cyclase/phosphodiesterase n=1 Tax=Iamia sp. SCSIO 61187 TaxID=2722752 RepID=UPI001C63213D|nr:EAL domain-containing protein [Iamia sp. SCSIO 61187]QYG91861.1 EAL domain-containing protein [Iamia sp. SCSIO 61187]